LGELKKDSISSKLALNRSPRTTTLHAGFALLKMCLMTSGRNRFDIPFGGELPSIIHLGGDEFTVVSNVVCELDAKDVAGAPTVMHGGVVDELATDETGFIITKIIH
jgi:hypothetical protein